MRGCRRSALPTLNLRSHTSHLRPPSSDVGPPTSNLRPASFAAVYNETVSGYLSTSNPVVVVVFFTIYVDLVGCSVALFVLKHGLIVYLCQYLNCECKQTSGVARNFSQGVRNTVISKLQTTSFTISGLLQLLCKPLSTRTRTGVSVLEVGQ